MNTLSTKHPIALTAASLVSVPYYLRGYIEACIEEHFPVYIDDAFNNLSLEALEQAIEAWSAHVEIEIIRGEAALAQTHIQTILDLGSSRSFQERLPLGFRGQIGVLVERETQINASLEAMVRDKRAFILSSKRWDEHSPQWMHILRQSFFLPPAWQQSSIRRIKEARMQATGSHTLLVYNTLEWKQSLQREAMVEAIKKTSLCATLDSAVCDGNRHITLLAQANTVILEIQNPAEINAWLQLCAELNIPCQPIYGTRTLSPIRKLAYGIPLAECIKEDHSIKEILRPVIQLIKEGTASLELDCPQLEKTAQELRPKRVMDTLQAWLQSSRIQRQGAKFLFYSLPQERTLHINPEAWSNNGICDDPVWPTERCSNPEQIKEAFLLLKNRSHWANLYDPRVGALARQCMHAYLFQEPNATWQRDFHAIWSQWDGFFDACEAAVKEFYACAAHNKNAYTQIAHGIMVGLVLNDEDPSLIKKAQRLIKKDKDLNRYTRITPHEETLALAFQGNIEQAEAILAETYRTHKKAFDGYKVLGQWAHAYGTRRQALDYYNTEKAEGRRSQECAIQHALIRSENEPLETVIDELKTPHSNPMNDEESLIELVIRYARVRFSSMSLVNKLPDEKANWSCIAELLNSPNTRRGQSIASLAKGLVEGPDAGDAAFDQDNTHPMHHYYWALMHAAHGNWDATKAHLSLLSFPQAPVFPIQVWSSAQGLLSNHDQCKLNEASIHESIELIENNAKQFPMRTPAYYALLAELNLYVGKKDPALAAIDSLSKIGSRGWRAEYSAILSWTGNASLAESLIHTEANARHGSNENFFYQALAHALLGNQKETQQALAALKRQNPNYFEEQAAFRHNIFFWEMAIAEVIDDTHWRELSMKRAQACDPWFENKNKRWNAIREKYLTTA
jgi:hypothetical protein